MKERKIGILTLGVSLVIFGILFLLRMFLPALDYLMVLKFWPIVLILLGAEVLLAVLLPQKEGNRPKFDGMSVLLICFLLLVSATLAAIQFAMENIPTWIT